MDSKDWDRRYSAAELLWSTGPNRSVAAELEDVPPGSALDLAAGEGRHAVWLATKGFRVHAVDFSSVALERGRRRADAEGVTVDWQQADVERWTPAEAEYDLVLVAYLHLPWPRMRIVLSRAGRAVAPGGLFLLVGHDRANVTEGVGGPSDVTVVYGAQQVAAELPAFEVEKAIQLERPVPTEQGPRAAIDCLVRAVRRCDV